MNAADALVRRQVGILRYSRGVSADVLRLIERTERGLASQTERELRRLESLDRTPTQRVKRMQQMLREMKRERADLYGEVSTRMQEALGDFAVAEERAVRRILANAVREHNWLGIDTHTIRLLASEQPILGTPLDKWVESIGRNASLRIERKVAQGILTGQTTPEIVRAIRETVWGGTRANVTAVVRTAITNVAATAREALYYENRDVVWGVEWISTLDDRTTDICIGYDGQLFELGTGPRPPAHVNCRSVAGPVLWDEILGDRKGFALRASATGLTRAKTYSEWLGRMDGSLRSSLATGSFRDLSPGGLSLRELEEIFG